MRSNLLDAYAGADVEKLLFSSSAPPTARPKSCRSPRHARSGDKPYGDTKLIIGAMLGWYGDAYG